ncbi:aminoglycoside adenylyltransferase domain-containing protein [Actinoplanes sp. NPDC024001]|uniref:aminoglycoside adenylyltransferase domain-containing protein n=1 Tax=Actinoplanes sp. NPDC024001 TaxID=3154598 RepID=UPI0033FC0661
MLAAEQLAGRVADIVGEATRSVILHGSLAAGGFRAGSSDIDLLVVVDDGISDAQAAALEDLVRGADVGDATGIDLHVVTAAAAGAPRPAPALELQVGRYDGSSVEFEAERRVAAAPDLITELSMARADGRALRGAPPAEVIAPIPAQWVISRGRHWLTAWRSLTDDTENAAFMVLTACRIWHFAVENAYCSKSEAARWALRRDSSLTVVRQALVRYERDPAAVVDERGIAGLLDLVLRDTATT